MSDGNLRDADRIEMVFSNTPISSYIIIAASALSLAINLVFLASTCHGIRSKTLPWKRHCFLINLAVADVLVSLAVLAKSVIASEAHHMSICSITIGLFMTRIGTIGSVYAVGFNYTVVCVIQKLAITRPILYKTKITKRLCLGIIVAGWAMAVVQFTITRIIPAFALVCSDSCAIAVQAVEICISVTCTFVCLASYVAMFRAIYASNTFGNSAARTVDYDGAHKSLTDAMSVKRRTGKATIWLSIRLLLGCIIICPAVAGYMYTSTLKESRKLYINPLLYCNMIKTYSAEDMQRIRFQCSMVTVFELVWFIRATLEPLISLVATQTYVTCSTLHGMRVLK